MLKRVITTSNFLCIFLFVVASTPVSIFLFQRPGKLEAISLEDLKKVEQSKCNGLLTLQDLDSDYNSDCKPNV